jgi:hypothetical protein
MTFVGEEAYLWGCEGKLLLRREQDTTCRRSTGLPELGKIELYILPLRRILQQYRTGPSSWSSLCRGRSPLMR